MAGSSVDRLQPMESVVRNVLLSGVIVFFVVGIFAAIQIQNSQARIEEAEIAAAMLGQVNARESAAVGEIYLLRAASGWGPSETPGLDLRTYRDCLTGHVELKVFRNFGDMFFEPKPEEHYQNLVRRPEETRVYAEAFNREMLRRMPASLFAVCGALGNGP